MAGRPTTLRDALTQAKPMIPCNMPRGKESRNARWPEVENAITIWHDFNLTNLNESYGQILDLPIPESVQLPPTPHHVLAGISINQIHDIHHLTCWNDQILQPTVGFAKRRLGIEPGIGLHYSASTPDQNFQSKLPAMGKVKVDHIIMLDDFDSLVIGLGRPTRWSARVLTRRLPQVEKELLWPLRQLAQLCRYGKTRYGYIQTSEELTVCRYSAEDLSNRESWKMAIQSIPWARSGADALTTDLALWWLCMLSLSGQHHRVITREEDIVEINAWDIIYLDEERGWVRRHRYSNIEVPTDPPSPPMYQTPEPGNTAAFEAGVGLHAMDDFEVHGDAQNNRLPDLDPNFNYGEFDISGFLNSPADDLPDPNNGNEGLAGNSSRHP